MRVRFAKRADRDLQQQQDWWTENGNNPNLLVEELRRTVELLATTPYAGSLVENSRPGTRRVLLRTRHVLFYRVNERDGFIDVLRVWHTSRGDRPKL